MIDDDRRRIVEGYIAAYNAVDVEAMLASMHADIEFRNVSGGGVNASASGIDEFRTLAETAAALFRWRRQRILGWRIDGDVAIADIAYESELAADVPGLGHRGDILRLTGTSEFRFADGKIRQLTDYS